MNVNMFDALSAVRTILHQQVIRIHTICRQQSANGFANEAVQFLTKLIGNVVQMLPMCFGDDYIRVLRRNAGSWDEEMCPVVL